MEFFLYFMESHLRKLGNLVSRFWSYDIDLHMVFGIS